MHRYDVFHNDHDGTVESSEWPTLGDVLGELEAWFYENFERLTP